jgi:hypothetical protein
MPPAKEQISQRAYEIYLARGCEDGHDLSDSIEAERQLSESHGPQTKRHGLLPSEYCHASRKLAPEGECV